MGDKSNQAWTFLLNNTALIALNIFFSQNICTKLN